MQQASNQKATRSRARAIMKCVFGLSVFAALVYVADVVTIVRALREISLADLGILAALSVALISVSVVKWRAFLRRLHISATFGRLCRLYLVGYFINIFTPSFIGGDVVRSLYVGPGVDRVHAVSATFLERYTGIVAMLLMALTAVFASDVVTPQIRFIVIAMALGCAVATWMVFSGLLNRVASRLRLPQRIVVVLERVHEGMVWGMGDRPLLVRALGLSVVFHLLTVVNTAAVGMAVGWIDIPLEGLLVVVPLILLVGAIPISPQGLGIQEGAFMFFLHSLGATSAQALAIALVLRAKSYVLALLGGLLWFGVRSTPTQKVQ
jgi:uncharacterized protein (TIRG00374 family)